MNQIDFSDKLMTSQKTYSNYETGKSLPDSQFIINLMKILNVDPTWVISDGEIGTMFRDSTVNGIIYGIDGRAMKGLKDEGLAILPILNIKASAGPGEEAFFVDSKRNFIISRRLLWPYDTELSRARILEVRGDSMDGDPAHLCDGDHVIYIEGLNEGSNGIYVINVGGQIRIKRIQFMVDGRVKIISDNKSYEAETINQQEIHFDIIGKVIKKIH